MRGVDHETPTVSIGIPTLDEEANIERVLDVFLASAYPAIESVFVADGGSTDRTREIVEARSSTDPRVRLIDNPERIQAGGLNRIIAAAGTDILVRADAHCIYAADYVERIVQVLVARAVVAAGGAQRYIACSTLQSGVALAQRTRLGGGAIAYRNETHDGFSSTVFLGAFWLRDLAEVGGYSLKATNEDVELCVRLAKAASARGKDAKRCFYTSPTVRVWYFPRATMRGLWKQYLNYGRGRYQTLRDHSGGVPVRGHAPFLLVLAATLFLLIDIFAFRGALNALTLFAAGLVAIFAFAIELAMRNDHVFRDDIWRGAGRPPGILERGLTCGVVLVAQPVAHALGYGDGLVRHRLIEPIAGKRA